MCPFLLPWDPNRLTSGDGERERRSVKGDEDSEAETEDENGDEEVAVGEDGSGALGFVHE